MAPFNHRLYYLVLFFMLPVIDSPAQDTVVLNGQPSWSRSMPIFDNCVIYQDKNNKPLKFEEVIRQEFVPYIDSLRIDRPIMRPFIIEWFRFTVKNTSATDTIKLKLNPGGHYFTQLYDSGGFVARSGIYEGRLSGLQRVGFSIWVLPSATKTFWLRTIDRQGHFTPAWISLDTPAVFVENNFEATWNSRLLFLLMSVLTGCLFFITLFAAYQYYLYRDKAFLWYMAYTLSAGFTGLFWIDIRHQFGIFSPFMLDLIFSVFLFFIPVLYTLFIGKMLDLPQQFKKAWKFVKALLVIACVQMVIEFTTIRTGQFPFPGYYGYFVSVVPVTILNILLLVLTAKSREKVKWFMFGGLLSMLLLWCMPMIVLINLEYRMSSVGFVLIFIPFYFLLGLTVEAICFSFALSYKSKLVLIEKNKLQQQYNIRLQEELNRRTAELHEQNRLVETQKMQQLQTALEKRIAETEMAALRAQMNPHFIFNCLNSIKLYTLENDAVTASGYLTSFSQLIRLVLENSRSEKVTLQKELETLKLYIELESMRFKNKIKCIIKVSPAVDQQFTEIPPLLIQPYVENAIWHGLMHKKDGGTINIEIDQLDENILQVIIADDGVGREQAAIYKSKSAIRQKSFGLRMTSERIDIINQVYNITAEVKVEDLEDEQHNPCGTKVIIKIPV